MQVKHGPREQLPGLARRPGANAAPPCAWVAPWVRVTHAVVEGGRPYQLHRIRRCLCDVGQRAHNGGQPLGVERGCRSAAAAQAQHCSGKGRGPVRWEGGAGRAGRGQVCGRLLAGVCCVAPSAGPPIRPPPPPATGTVPADTEPPPVTPCSPPPTIERHGQEEARGDAGIEALCSCRVGAGAGGGAELRGPQYDQGGRVPGGLGAVKGEGCGCWLP